MKNESIEIINNIGTILQAERYERLLPVADIEHSQRFREVCRSCPHYGKNLACPPNAPDFNAYLKKARTARVICLRIALTNPETPVDQQQADVQQASKFLAAELKRYLGQKYRVAGSGHCQSCESCAVESGETVCHKPLERIFSLEALGVDVGILLKRSFGFSLEWNRGPDLARYLYVVGAVFYDENQISLT